VSAYAAPVVVVVFVVVAFILKVAN
jgi:hypothetical protein